jgi:hypothetical protein
VGSTEVDASRVHVGVDVVADYVATFLLKEENDTLPGKYVIAVPITWLHGRNSYRINGSVISDLL